MSEISLFPGTRSPVDHVAQRALASVGRAAVNAIDDTKLLQTLGLTGPLWGETPVGVQHLQNYGWASVPLAGAEASVIHVLGKRSHPLVIAVGDRRYRMKNMAGGEVAIYDDQGQYVYLSRNGIVVNGDGKPILFQNAAYVSMQCDLHVTGEVIAKYGTAGSVTLSGHTTSGVTPGAGVSGVPVGGT
jgi:phage gp45-like